MQDPFSNFLISLRLVFQVHFWTAKWTSQASLHQTEVGNGFRKPRNVFVLNLKSRPQNWIFDPKFSGSLIVFDFYKPLNFQFQDAIFNPIALNLEKPIFLPNVFSNLVDDWNFDFCGFKSFLRIAKYSVHLLHILKNQYYKFLRT